jgi:ABC-type nitrate/sulfonate/bicarbonate transport system substrate-binding protein
VKSIQSHCRKLAAAIVVPLAILASPAAAQTTEVRVGYSTLFNTGFHLYAADVAPEIYEKHGIKVTPVDMQANAANCIAALIGGTIDMCSTSAPSGTFAISEGAPIKAIAVIQGPMFQVYLSKAAAGKTGVAPDAAVADRVKGLKGLDVVAPAPGTLYYNFLQEILRGGGMSIEDMRYRTLVDQVAMRQGLTNGSFEAVGWGAGMFGDLEKDGTIFNWLSVPRGDFPNLSVLPTVTIFASDAWLAANPDKVEAVHAGFVDMVAALKADPAKFSAPIKAKHFPDMNDVVWQQSFSDGLAALWDSGKVTESGWNTLLDMQKAGASGKDFSSAEWAKVVVPVAQQK